MMVRILLNYEHRDNDREIDEIELIGVRHSFPIILLRCSNIRSMHAVFGYQTVLSQLNLYYRFILLQGTQHDVRASTTIQRYDICGFDGAQSLACRAAWSEVSVAIQLKNRQRPVLQPASDWETCRLIARSHGKSFYVASLCLPAERRRAIHAVYAFCRTADDIVDRANCLESASLDLDAWERELDAPVSPVARAFALARVCYGVPEDAARELLAGVRMDLAQRRYATWAELRQYCYAVAGTVGLMTAPILGCRDAAALTHAADLGIAMQLTNILRDICEDAAQGRLYLPVEELAAFDVDVESVLSGRPNGAFRDFLAFQISRARDLYASAEQGIPALDASGRLATLAAKQFYSEILTEIEKLDYDVFRTRAHLTTGRKIRALPGVFVGFTQLSLSSARFHA